MALAHLHALQRVPTAHTIVAVHDATPEAAQAFAARTGATPSPTLGAMLREARPDIVHVCTPPETHFAVASEALRGGAHVYVEKPFADTQEQADTLLDLARHRHLVVCAGHQLVRDPAFQALLARVRDIGPVVQIDSTFNFRPVDLRLERAAPPALARMLLDILPHPLYTLIMALERVTPEPSAIDLALISAGPADVHAVLRGDGVFARLAVSLRARPVASTLAVTGAGGTLTADFVRGCLLGAANPGTAPLEKIGNPVVEGWRQATRSLAGIGRRLLGGGGYPGLSELIDEFYRSVMFGAAPPLSPEHLRRVSTIHEQLAGHVWHAARRPASRPRIMREPPSGAPVAVLTGARGFLGRELARQLAWRGFRVRGITRAASGEDRHVHQWVRTDLGRPINPDVFAGADVVVHAASETAGGFEAHQRNSIDATRHVLAAMRAAGVTRLVHVSSISVVRPPRSLRERQVEQTPRADGARWLGPYTWGKSEAERVVVEESAALGIEARIVRPGALVDWMHPEVPGLLGRRLFGRWHLGLGRPGLPIAVCDVRKAARVIVWCAERFAQAPAVLNLIDPALGTRRRVLERFRDEGWRGRMVWVPIPLLATAFAAIRTVLGLARGQRPERMSPWAILRPRWFDPALSATVLAAAHHPAAATPPPQTASAHG
jgi:predicted dehydrogenase/nucleoside-diphosphate-sugar epimerase